MKTLARTFALITCTLLATPAIAGNTPPPDAQIESGFSPGGSAEALILKAIGSAQKSIRVAAYSFTSKPIATALLDAHKRGIDVQVIVDESQRTEKYTSATFLANTGIPIRVDSTHVLQHNKYLIIDSRHVQTGSYNYSASATYRNAENVLIIWNNQALAKTYLTDWDRHWQHAEPYAAQY